MAKCLNRRHRVSASDNSENVFGDPSSNYAQASMLLPAHPSELENAQVTGTKSAARPLGTASERNTSVLKELQNTTHGTSTMPSKPGIAKTKKLATLQPKGTLAANGTKLAEPVVEDKGKEGGGGWDGWYGSLVKKAVTLSTTLFSLEGEDEEEGEEDVVMEEVAHVPAHTTKPAQATKPLRAKKLPKEPSGNNGGGLISGNSIVSSIASSIEENFKHVQNRVGEALTAIAPELDTDDDDDGSSSHHDTGDLLGVAGMLGTLGRSKSGRAVDEERLAAALKASRDVANAMSIKARDLQAAVGEYRLLLSESRTRAETLQAENGRLREEIARTQLEEDPAAEQMRRQMEVLLQEKARLAADLERVKRENDHLHQLVEYRESFDEASAGPGTPMQGGATPVKENLFSPLQPVADGKKPRREWGLDEFETDAMVN
eukprot:jgi/Mesvir1/22447/Mv17916-RA.1